MQEGSLPLPRGQAEMSVDRGNLQQGDGGQMLLPHPTAISPQCDYVSFTAAGANFCKTEEKWKQNRRDFCLFAAPFLLLAVLLIFLHFLLQRPEEAEFCCCAWEHFRAWDIL